MPKSNHVLSIIIVSVALAFAVGLLLGIPIGMMMQQAAFIEGFDKLAPALDKINVNVGLNETFLVEETKRVAMAVFNSTQ